MPTLKQLKYFVAVAKTLNFRKAAEKVYLSQPALSQQIKKLEVELGVRLLERDQHQVALTDAGEVFLKEARKASAQVDRAVMRAREAVGVKAEHLKVSVPEALTADLLPVIERFRRARGDLVLEIVELDTPDLVTALLAGYVDVGFAGLAVPDEEIGVRKVLSIPFVVALSEENPLAMSKKVGLTDLKSEPFIFIARQDLPPLHDYLMGFLAAAGVTPNIVRRANRFQQVMSLVAGGVGVNLCPATYRAKGRPGVRFITLEEPRPELSVSLAWNSKNASNAVMTFVSEVCEK